MTASRTRAGRRRDLVTQVELSGLSLEATRLGAEWKVPSGVWVQGLCLVGTVGGGRAKTVVDPVEDFLSPFAALGETDNLAEDVERFGRRWGLLGVCEHGLPSTHALHRFDSTWPGGPPACKPFINDGHQVEPLDAWRLFGGQANAIMRATAAITSGQPVDQGVWTTLASLYPSGLEPESKQAIVDRRRRHRRLHQHELAQVSGVGDIRIEVFGSDGSALAFAIRRWLDLGDVRPVFTWSNHGAIGFGATTLFGALALRLAMLSASPRGLKWCTFCTYAYPPEPRERANRHCCYKPQCEDARRAENVRRYRAGAAQPRGPYTRRGDGAP